MSEEFNLSADQTYFVADVAAKVYGAVLLHVAEVLTPEQSAAMAVEVAVAIRNEVNEYRLRDGRAVRRSVDA